MLAELTVVPLDKAEEGFSRYVAQCVRLIRESGLDYVLTPMSTIVEGDAEAVFDLVKKVHLHIAAQSARVSTTVHIDDRRGRSGCLKGKVESVRRLLDGGEDH
ncbi:MAG: thiamine-binding protein [Myxococcales bacterium]|nr:MAG: thiamine-binding protein [Myxococcales bacterium]